MFRKVSNAALTHCILWYATVIIDNSFEVISGLNFATVYQSLSTNDHNLSCKNCIMLHIHCTILFKGKCRCWLLFLNINMLWSLGEDVFCDFCFCFYLHMCRSFWELPTMIICTIYCSDIQNNNKSLWHSFTICDSTGEP